MEFLQTPDVNKFARTPAHHDSTNNATTPVHQHGADSNNNTNTVNASANAAAAPGTVPWSNFITPSLMRPSSGSNKGPDGSRQDIKNSFRALFSPGPGVSASPFLSGAYNYYPGITPYIAPSHSPVVDGTPTDGDDEGNKKDDGTVDGSTLMSSPRLRMAAKEAVAKEFMNMPTFGGVNPDHGHTSPGLSAASVEQTVPGNEDAKKNNLDHGVPVEEGNKDETMEPKGEDGKNNESHKGAAPSGVPVDKNGMPLPHMIPMYPLGMRGFPAPPPGMHAMHPMGYPFPMMIPAQAGAHMVGGYMPAMHSLPVKQPIKANETPEEKKARVEREKEELIREFKKKTREAALVRFRQKRRERKFGKLIRYDCRKKLADARPRVKGRFVRVKEVKRNDHVVPSVVK